MDNLSISELNVSIDFQVILSKYQELQKQKQSQYKSLLDSHEEKARLQSQLSESQNVSIKLKKQLEMQKLRHTQNLYNLTYQQHQSDDHVRSLMNQISELGCRNEILQNRLASQNISLVHSNEQVKQYIDSYDALIARFQIISGFAEDKSQNNHQLRDMVLQLRKQVSQDKLDHQSSLSTLQDKFEQQRAQLELDHQATQERKMHELKQNFEKERELIERQVMTQKAETLAQIEQKQQLQENISTLMQKFSVWKEQLSAKNMQISDIQKQYSSLQSELSQLKMLGNLNQLSYSQRLDDHQLSHQAEIGQLRQQVHILQSQLTASKHDYQDLCQENVRMIRECEEVTAMMNQKADQLNSVMNEKNKVDMQYTRHAEEITDLTQQVTTKDRKIHAIQKEADSLKTENISLKDAVQSHLEDISRMEKQFCRMVEAEVVDERIAQIQTQLKNEHQETLDVLQYKEALLETKETELANLQQSLTEDHQVSQQRQKKIVVQNQQIAKLNDTLQQLEAEACQKELCITELKSSAQSQVCEFDNALQRLKQDIALIDSQLPDYEQIEQYLDEINPLLLAYQQDQAAHFKHALLRSKLQKRSYLKLLIRQKRVNASEIQTLQTRLDELLSFLKGSELRERAFSEERKAQNDLQEAAKRAHEMSIIQVENLQKTVDIEREKYRCLEVENQKIKESVQEYEKILLGAEVK